MSPLVAVLVDAVVALARLAPEVVSAIQAIVAGGATPEEQRAAIAQLKAKLTDDVARVEAVRFRDA